MSNQRYTPEFNDKAGRPVITGIQPGCEVPPSPGKADLVKAGGAAITTQ